MVVERVLICLANRVFLKTNFIKDVSRYIAPWKLTLWILHMQWVRFVPGSFLFVYLILRHCCIAVISPRYYKIIFNVYFIFMRLIWLIRVLYFIIKGEINALYKWQYVYNYFVLVIYCFLNGFLYIFIRLIFIFRFVSLCYKLAFIWFYVSIHWLMESFCYLNAIFIIKSLQMNILFIVLQNVRE